MSTTNRSVSSTTIDKNPGQSELFIKIINTNTEVARTLTLNVYDQDNTSNGYLPIYVDDQQIETDTIDPETARTYKVDVSKVARRVVLEIIRTDGSGSSFSMKQSSNAPSALEMHIR